MTCSLVAIAILRPDWSTEEPDWEFLVAAGGSAVVLTTLLILSSGRITIESNGLRHRWLWLSQEIPWERVDEVRDDVGGFFRSPALVLILRRPEKAPSLGRGRTAPFGFRIGLGWKDREQLVGEVLARVRKAALSEELPAEPHAPRRVPWRYRVLPLGITGFCACSCGYVLVSALASDGVAIDPFFVAVVGLALTCLLGWGAIDSEWRWKTSLVRAHFLGGMVLLAAAWRAWFLGAPGALMVVAGVLSGWSLVTFVVCLPIRPRGWRVAVSYVLVIAPLATGAWWLGGRDPVPLRRIKLAGPTPLQIAWSPDGRLLYAAGQADGKESPTVCQVVDTSALQATNHTLPRGVVPVLLIAAQRYALFIGSDEHLGKRKRELWCLDSATGKSTRLHASPLLSIAQDGSVSPDGSEVLFLADEVRYRQAFVVRLGDLSKHRYQPEADLSRFGGVRWRAGGGLVLTQLETPKEGPQTLSLWSLAPGDTEAKCLHQTTAPEISWRFSPDARWALILLERGGIRVNACELVDLSSGQSRPLEPVPDSLYRARWAPDQPVVAYSTREAGQEALILADAPTGKVAHLYTARNGSIEAPAISRGARHAACVIRGESGPRLVIIEVATGRVIRPRGLGVFPLLQPLAWSPTQPTLATAMTELFTTPPKPEIRLYDLDPH